jgi:hypothetical protein
MRKFAMLALDLILLSRFHRQRISLGCEQPAGAVVQTREAALLWGETSRRSAESNRTSSSSRIRRFDDENEDEDESEFARMRFPDLMQFAAGHIAHASLAFSLSFMRPARSLILTASERRNPSTTQSNADSLSL